MQQLLLALPFKTSYHPADFVASTCNKDALFSVKNRFEWPSFGLCIVGAKESGKTHLTAVYHAEIPTAVSLPALDIKKKMVFDINASHIIIDNADKVRDETAFFHLINLVKQRKGSLFMTATTPPSTWKIRLPDLKSRLCSLPVIRLLDHDSALMGDILLKLFSDRQIFIDKDLAEYILKHIRLDITIIHQLVDLLYHEICLTRKALTRATFRGILFNHTEMMNTHARERFLGSV